jgi:hypothetical protein
MSGICRRQRHMQLFTTATLCHTPDTEDYKTLLAPFSPFPSLFIFHFSQIVLCVYFLVLF